MELPAVVTARRPVPPAERNRLTATTGLAALSLDAMASVAYGPEAIVLVLAAAGSHAVGFTLPVAIMIVILLAVLIASYRQLIAAFPDGGGAYAVAKRRLGRWSSLVAAASLVVDYVLNVAVSVAAGTAALTSAVPAAGEHKVAIALAVLALVTALNLRGIVTGAKVFIGPTVVFVTSILVVIAVGIIGGAHPDHPLPVETEAVGTVGILLLLKAFANGCAALTGVEAIANATPQFRENRIRRAQRAEVALGILLGTMMLGIAYLVSRLNIGPRDDSTVLASLTESVLGHGVGYYVVQTATVILLALAANTSFGGLPQLFKVLAADDLLPHRLRRRSARGVYREGVLLLAGASAALIVITRGEVNMLVPLFAIGVFIGFTLAQAGLVRHWLIVKGPHWQARTAINAFGAVLTGIAAIVVTTMKATEGSLWILVVLALLVYGMHRMAKHYARRRESSIHDLEATHDVRSAAGRHRSLCARGIVVVPVADISGTACLAVNRARAFGRQVIALHVGADTDADFRARWREQCPMVELVELAADPDESQIEPIVDFVAQRSITDDVLVMIPDGDLAGWHRLLSGGMADDLEAELRSRTSALTTRVALDRESAAIR